VQVAIALYDRFTAPAAIVAAKRASSRFRGPAQ
jgi:hypothetical protein